MKKRLLFFTVAVLLTITSASAQGGTTGPLTWNINSGTLTISGEGAMPDYAKWNETPWFEHRLSIINIVMENGVTCIGNNAFSNFKEMTSVAIPNSLTRIGEDSFSVCLKLPSITLPNSVTSIEDRAFLSCEKLTSIHLNSVKDIGNYAFAYCKFNSITIPKSVNSIGSFVFFFCLELASIEVENENNTYASDDGILYNKSKTTLIYCPILKKGKCVLPNGVMTIGDHAFEYSNLTLITLPNSLKNIGAYAFTPTDLPSITIPCNVTYIGEYAFANYKPYFTFSPTCLNPTPIKIDPTVFDGVQGCLVVPTSAVSAYKNSEVWNNSFNECIYGGGIFVNSSANNSEYGYITGGGLFKENDMVLLTAIPLLGYEFVNWTKHGEEVSNNNPFGFYVTEDMELVANFIKKSGIKNIENHAIKVFPNPTTEELTIDNGELTINNIEIFDIYGRKQQAEGRKQNVIDISQLSAGIYFVKISTEAGEVVKKIIKQ